MVRAAFEGDGASFPSIAALFRVSTAWRTARTSGGNGNRDKSSSDEAALSARLGSLDHRLSEIRDSRKIGTDQPGAGSGDGAARASAMARGFRLSSELIAGVVVGALIGWGFDRLLSTSPLGPHRVRPARLHGRRGQRDAIGRRCSGQDRPLKNAKPDELIAERRRGRRNKRCGADDRSDPPVQYPQDLHDRPYRQSGDRLHQFVGLHVRLGGADLAADDRRHRRTAAGARPHAVGRRNLLRIRRQHHPLAPPARKA